MLIQFKWERECDDGAGSSCRLARAPEGGVGGAAEQKTGLRMAGARWDCRASFFRAAGFGISDARTWRVADCRPPALYSLFDYLRERDGHEVVVWSSVG